MQVLITDYANAQSFSRVPSSKQVCVRLRGFKHLGEVADAECHHLSRLGTSRKYFEIIAAESEVVDDVIVSSAQSIML